MKDTVITVRRKKIEIWTLLACFVIANLINVYAINKYDTEWNELFWSLGFVLIAMVVIYVVWSLLRMLVYAIISPFRKKKRR